MAERKVLLSKMLSYFSFLQEIVSGGSDSQICFWRDNTEEEKEKKEREQELEIERTQELQNLIREGKQGEKFSEECQEGKWD